MRRSSTNHTEPPPPRSNEEAALLARIHAGDDEAFAAYAGWLVARRDPRGELMRLQCEPEPTGFRQRRARWRREAELLRLFERVLKRTLGRHRSHGDRGEAPPYERGIFVRARCTFESVRQLDDLVARAPFVRELSVGIDCNAHDPREALSVPALAKLCSLKLMPYGRNDAADLTATELARATHLHGVLALDIHQGLTPVGARALVRGPRLRQLGVTFDHLATADVALLLSALPLEALRLQQSKVRADTPTFDLEGFAKLPELRRLRALRMTDLGDPMALAQLFTAPSLATIEELELFHSDLWNAHGKPGEPHPASASMLSALATLRHVRALEINGDNFTAGFAKSLPASVRRLTLCMHSPIADEDFAELARRRLEFLHLPESLLVGQGDALSERLQTDVRTQWVPWREDA